LESIATGGDISKVMMWIVAKDANSKDQHKRKEQERKDAALV
jgi:hypothetical protein